MLHNFHYSHDFHFHPYNTRNKDLLRLPLTPAKTTKYQSSFRYVGAKAWNDSPYKLGIENSFLKFKKVLNCISAPPNLVAEVEFMTFIVDLYTYLFPSYFSSSYSFT